MIGCPKLDDAQAYIDKFTAIFRDAGIRSITTVMMEVPCCSGLSVIVRQALEKANIPIDMIAGTSAGSLFGGLYAIGKTVDEIANFAKNLIKQIELCRCFISISDNYFRCIFMNLQSSF